MNLGFMEGEAKSSGILETTSDAEGLPLRDFHMLQILIFDRQLHFCSVTEGDYSRSNGTRPDQESKAISAENVRLSSTARSILLLTDCRTPDLNASRPVPE